MRAQIFPNMLQLQCKYLRLKRKEPYAQISDLEENSGFLVNNSGLHQRTGSLGE